MKKILIIWLTLSFLFLSSCIKMDSTLVVNDDLSMDWVTIFDYTQLNATTSWFSNFWTWTEIESSDIKKPCDNLSWTWWLSAWDFKEISCINIDENIAKVIWKWQSIQDFVKVKNWNYILDLKPIVESNSDDDWKTEEEKIQSINSMRTMWFQMNYIIKLPTEIIESNVWRINWDELSFDIYEFTDVKNPYVIFKSNWNLDKNIINDFNVQLDTKQVLFKKLILSKRELEKTYKWRKDVAKFEALIPRVNNNKLVDLNNRISNIDKSNRLYKKYEDFLNYLDAKIWLEIYKRGLNK